MPRMSGTISVPANATTTNQLAGLNYEFVPAAAIVTLAAAAAATGVNVNFNVGGLAVVIDSLLSQANRFPIKPDDVVTQIGGDAGERLFVTFRNTTGGALVVFWTVDIDTL